MVNLPETSGGPIRILATRPQLCGSGNRQSARIVLDQDLDGVRQGIHITDRHSDGGIRCPVLNLPDGSSDRWHARERRLGEYDRPGLVPGRDDQEVCALDQWSQLVLGHEAMERDSRGEAKFIHGALNRTT
jgi:hypothetical protein